MYARKVKKYGTADYRVGIFTFVLVLIYYYDGQMNYDQCEGVQNGILI
jgi:hypothetical protein